MRGEREEGEECFDVRFVCAAPVRTTESLYSEQSKYWQLNVVWDAIGNF